MSRNYLVFVKWFVGSAIQLTSGMGGDSKDMASYTIPVRPKKPTGEAAVA